ncbi:MAG: serine/threonine protein kinase [Pirellulales bacterium]|nr:serine/threonine protein kinase [Pirellulales bacterium]
MSLPPTQQGGPREAVSGTARFAFAGGSRPLEGYTIKRGVGHGGFGEVYYATSDAGKEVALKLIRRSLDVELRGIKQCLNLKHPNLLDVYDIREDERGDHWVVMEYVAGASLDEVLAAHPEGLSTEQALAWFHGMAAGVAYLHDHGIVHRDLKPANIFSDEGRVQIGDYGLSKFISCSRRSGHTESVGTVHYMAPEVANGRYGKEIDIYALGIILYEMLTGRVPFEGESVGEVLMKHLTAKPDLSAVAEPYRGVIAQALEKDPANRFGSVGQMLARLPLPLAREARVDSSTFSAGSKSNGRGGPTAAPGGDTPFAQVIEEDEPVLRAVKELFGNLREGWANLNMPARVILTTLGILGALMTFHIWITVGMVLLMAYVGYRIIRAIVLVGQPRAVRYVAPPPPPPATPTPAPRTPSASANAAAMAKTGAWRRPRHHRPRRGERPLPALVLKPVPQRVAELLGSMLLGTLVALTMCLVLAIVAGFGGELPKIEQCAWVALVGIAGTWAVMLPSKLWEGTRGEAVLRRFGLMVIGLGLGGFAWASSQWLLVSLPYDGRFPESPFRLPASFYQNGPTLLAYVAVFGTLMLFVRWWWQADPLRHARLSLWSLVVTSLVAGLVSWLWHFPQPWLVMVACTMSIAVQLASPWLPPHRRQAEVSEE